MLRRRRRRLWCGRWLHNGWVIWLCRRDQLRYPPLRQKHPQQRLSTRELAQSQPQGDVTHLVVKRVSPSEVLAVHYTPRPRLLKLLQALDSWDIRHPIMTTRHNHSIKGLAPPVILLLSLLSQHNFPLIAGLLNVFHSGVV